MTAFGSLVISVSVLGGPSQPHLVAQPRLEEIAPIIENVEIKKGDPFIEVFITGTGHLDCYDSREYQVEVGTTSTRIIPRLKRTNALRSCKKDLKSFRDKAADLDPYNPASQEVEVLGFRGIHRKRLTP